MRDQWIVKDEKDDFGDLTGKKGLEYVTIGEAEDAAGTREEYEFFISSYIDEIRGFQWKLKLCRYQVFRTILGTIKYKVKIDNGSVFEYELDKNFYDAGDVPLDISQLLLQYKLIKVAIIACYGDDIKRYNFSISSDGFKEAYDLARGKLFFGVWEQKEYPKATIDRFVSKSIPYNPHYYRYETNTFYSDGDEVKAEICLYKYKKYFSDGGVLLTLCLHVLRDGEYSKLMLSPKYKPRDVVYIEIDGKKYIQYMHVDDDEYSLNLDYDCFDDSFRDSDAKNNPIEESDCYEDPLPYDVIKNSGYMKVTIEFYSEDDENIPFVSFLINGRELVDLIRKVNSLDVIYPSSNNDNNQLSQDTAYDWPKLPEVKEFSEGDYTLTVYGDSYILKVNSNVALPNRFVVPETICGEGITQIDMLDFGKAAENITEIVIPNRIKRFRIGNNYWFKNVEKITVLPGNTDLIFEDGFLYDGSKSIIYCVLNNTRFPEKYFIPKSVSIIDEYAFANCDNLQSINIPDSVTEIREGAFADCSMLKEVILPKTVSILCDGLFNNCWSLEQIVIPDGICEIGSSTFSGCSSVRVIILPNTVNSIGDEAFYGCTSMRVIFMPKELLSIGESVFTDCNELAKVYASSSVYSMIGGLLDELERKPLVINLRDAYYFEEIEQNDFVSSKGKWYRVLFPSNDRLSFTVKSEGILSVISRGDIEGILSKDDFLYPTNVTEYELNKIERYIHSLF